MVVDGANVVGARPDGWWRDRAGAAERLVAAIAAARTAGVAPELLGGRVVVVLEGRASAADIAAHGDVVEVVRAPRDGDATIVALVPTYAPDDVLVVTSDRELRRRVEALGATTVGAAHLRDTLDRPT
nr:hypothetical protein [Cellulomonas sp. APG4]